MKTGTQKVGNKSGARPPLVVSVTRPETQAEALKICGGNEQAAVALFCRGLDIWRQDRVGRPMFDEGATQAEIEAAIASAVPGTTKGRGRPAKPKEVTLPKTRDGKLDAADVAALLAKHGIVAKLEG